MTGSFERFSSRAIEKHSFPSEMTAIDPPKYYSNVIIDARRSKLFHCYFFRVEYDKNTVYNLIDYGFGRVDNGKNRDCTQYAT